MLRRFTRLPSHACLYSSRSIASSAVRSSELKDPFNAFITRYPDDSDERSTRSGPLSHLRISIKDNFAVKSSSNIDSQDVESPVGDAGPTTCASRTLATFHSPYDATVVKLLRGSGARIVGKTNMDEFGMGSYGAYSHFDPVLNPRDTSRVAGGSSSGAAASVAGGLCDM